MKEKIEKCLIASGFGKLELQIPGVRIFYAIENNFINAIVLADSQEEPGLFGENFDMFTKKMDWKSGSGESLDVHTLWLIFTSDIAGAREFTRGNSFCWYIDTEQKQLVIEKDKCEDFYGMRAKLERCILSPDLPEEPEEMGDLPENNQGSKPENSREHFQNIAEKKQNDTFMNYGFIFVNVLIFILCIFTGDFLYDKGIFDLKAVLEEGQWYRLLTSTFLHADASHLVSNMLYLYLLGDIVERALGHGKYFLMYMGSGLIASGFSMLFSYLMQDYTRSLGASGAVFGVTGALLWIVLRNRGQQEVITIPKMIFLIVFSLYNGFVSTNIDNAAHVGGLLGGFLLTIVLYRKRKDRNTKQFEKREEEEA